MRLTAFILALALPLVPAQAQDYAPPKAGLAGVYQTWRSADNDPAMRTAQPPLTVEIHAVEADSALTRLQQDGQLLSSNATLRGIFTYRATLSEFETRLTGDHAPIRALWPLAAGKTAEMRLEQSEREVTPTGAGEWKPTGRTFVYRFRIEGEEQITLPAGQFQTWIIAREIVLVIADGARTRVEESRIWFAPALGWWVKFEHRAPEGTGTRLTVREAERITGN